MVKHTKKRILAVFMAICVTLLTAAPAFADTAESSATSQIESSAETQATAQLKENADPGADMVDSAAQVRDSSAAADSDADAEESAPSVSIEAGDNASENDIAAFADVVADANTSYSLKIGGHDTYMQGDPTGLFRPNNNITRAEVAEVLYKLLVNKPATTGGNFSDVTDGKWYAVAVNGLKNAGVIDGYPNGTFKPNSSITRAEVVKLVATFVTLKTGSNPFRDVSEKNWAYSYIITASSLGWVQGYKDGTFRPDNKLTRAEFVTMMNNVLERHDESFAENRNNSAVYFPDVKTTSWYFLDVVEGAKPAVTQPTPSTTTIITITGVNFRTGPSTSSSIIATLPILTVLTRLDGSTYGDDHKWYKASYNNTTGYIHSDYVTIYQGSTASSGSVSASSASLPQYKTLFLLGTTNDNSTTGISWSSSDTNVATVFIKPGAPNKAFVYGKAAGTATISFKNANGTVLGTCKVTVTAAEPVRFAYTDPNTPLVGQSFNLVAVTDANKSAVKFVVTGGGTYESTTYTTETKSASNSSAVPANTVRIFKSTVTFNVKGTYKVTAYAKTSGGWSSTGKSFEFLVSGDSSITATSDTVRSASTEIVKVIANFEGKGTEPGEVYIDTNSSGLVPTVGYGYVVNANGMFYNNLTETEMVAMLADTINNGVYTKNLEAFRKNNNVKMSQVQFDALVSFGYNLGTGYFKDGAYDTFTIFLNAMAQQTGTVNLSGKVNVASASVYASAAGTSSVTGSLAKGATVTITEIKRVDGNVDNLWYYVASGSTKGWIRGGTVRYTAQTARDTAYIDEQLFGSNLLQWNMAGSVRLPGLVYRRLAEAKIFCYGNYADAYNTSSNYRKNVGFDAPTNVPGLNLIS